MYVFWDRRVVLNLVGKPLVRQKFRNLGRMTGLNDDPLLKKGLCRGQKNSRNGK